MQRHSLIKLDVVLKSYQQVYNSF